LTYFSDLGLSEPILRAVTEEGYDVPTPIQAQVIPAMISGEDILGTAHRHCIKLRLWGQSRREKPAAL